MKNEERLVGQRGADPSGSLSCSFRLCRPYTVGSAATAVLKLMSCDDEAQFGAVQCLSERLAISRATVWTAHTFDLQNFRIFSSLSSF
jgi:hypothetical protein